MATSQRQLYLRLAGRRRHGRRDSSDILRVGKCLRVILVDESAHRISSEPSSRRYVGRSSVAKTYLRLPLCLRLLTTKSLENPRNVHFARAHRRARTVEIWLHRDGRRAHLNAIVPYKQLQIRSGMHSLESMKTPTRTSSKPQSAYSRTCKYSNFDKHSAI